MIDLEALKSRLANYDPAAPKCPLQIARFVNYAPDHITSLDAEYHDYDETTYVPCCRLEGHEGECQNGRQVMGWPDFETVSQLIAEVERLRERDDNFCDDFRRVTSEACAPDELHCSCVPHLRAQVAELQALGVSLHKAADAGAQAERAAVVAWLRDCALDPETTGAEMRLFQNQATTIERGEHRKEKE